MKRSTGTQKGNCNCKWLVLKWKFTCIYKIKLHEAKKYIKLISMHHINLDQLDWEATISALELEY